MAREVLEERGFVVVKQAHGEVLTTLWHASFAESSIAGVWTRFAVFGGAISPSTSHLRVVRTERYAAAVTDGNDDRPGRYTDVPFPVQAAAGNEQRFEEVLRGDPTYRDPDAFKPKTHSGKAIRDLVVEDEINRRIAARANRAPPPEMAPASASKLDMSSPTQLLDPTLCGEPISGLENVADARTLVLGEVPGTVEAPRFVGQAVCSLLVSGNPVTVALEIPHEEQPRVDRFMDSSGSQDDVERLLEGFFWNRPDQDGRSSAGMLALLQQLQTFRLAGLPVQVLAMDDPGLTGADRAEAMARPILRAQQGQQAGSEQKFVVLVGNLNARVITEPGMRATLATLLAQAESSKPLIALDMAFSSGTAWTCEMRKKLECGVFSVKATEANYKSWGWVVNQPSQPFRLRTPHVRRLAVRHLGIDGTFYLGELKASPPASSSK